MSSATIKLFLPLGDPKSLRTAEISNWNGKEELTCSIKGLVARGRRTPNGFVVFQWSQAVVENRPSAQKLHPYVVSLRERLAQDGTLALENGYYRFTKDTEFSSPSAAASVVRGGGSNGLIEWKDPEGRTLKDLETV